MNISLIFHALLGNEFFLVLDDDVEDAGDDDAVFYVDVFDLF